MKKIICLVLILALAFPLCACNSGKAEFYDEFVTLVEDEKYEEATEMKMEIVAAMEQELVLENMVKSLGFSDAVVSVSVDSDNVNVFINSAELNYDTALSIYNMMKNETGIVAGNVIIMPVYAES